VKNNLKKFENICDFTQKNYCLVDTRKIFQHRLIYFIHTNLMNTFSKLTNGEKVMKNRYKLFVLFGKNFGRHANFSV